MTTSHVMDFTAFLDDADLANGFSQLRIKIRAR